MFLYQFLRFLANMLFRLFFHIEVQGKKFIPKAGGFVLVSNHASVLDPIILGVACFRELNFAARDSLFRNRFFGRLIRTVGAFPIKRWSADLSAVRESILRLKEGFGLLVFPEGTRSLNGNMQDITSGFVLLARKAQVPIVPVWISGSQMALSKGSAMIKITKIKVYFGQPIYITQSQTNASIVSDVVERIKLLKVKENRLR